MISNLNTTTNNEYTYLSPCKDCKRCLSIDQMKAFTGIGKKYGERLSSSVKKYVVDNTSNKIDQINIKKKDEFRVYMFCMQRSISNGTFFNKSTFDKYVMSAHQLQAMSWTTNCNK